jgi:hypothetical protein
MVELCKVRLENGSFFEKGCDLRAFSMGRKVGSWNLVHGKEGVIVEPCRREGRCDLEPCPWEV